MDSSLDVIPLLDIGLAFVPALVVVGVLYRWPLEGRTAAHALSRMVLQLLAVGYVLTPLSSEPARQGACWLRSLPCC